MVLHSFFESIEILVTIAFIIPAIVFGIMTKSIQSDKDVAKMMSDTMASMGAYVVLAFIAGQFVAYFNWTNLGAITAVQGADVLKSIGLEGGLLMVSFLFVASIMNFLWLSIGQVGLHAPSVPMLMQMGLSPEATQAAYRVGDSITNIISPLMPYLPIIIVFAQVRQEGRHRDHPGGDAAVLHCLPHRLDHHALGVGLRGHSARTRRQRPLSLSRLGLERRQLLRVRRKLALGLPLGVGHAVDDVSGVHGIEVDASASAAAAYLPRQLRQKSASSMRSMFWTSVFACRWSRRRRKTAASIRVCWSSVMDSPYRRSNRRVARDAHAESQSKISKTEHKIQILRFSRSISPVD